MISLLIAFAPVIAALIEKLCPSEIWWGKKFHAKHKMVEFLRSKPTIEEIAKRGKKK